MTVSLVTVVTFLAAALAVAGVYSLLTDLYLRDRSRVSQRVDEEFSERHRARAKKAALFKDLGKFASEFAPDDMEELSVRASLQTMIEQAGLDVSVARLLGVAAAGGLVLALAGGWLGRSVVAGVVAGGVGAAVPFVYVRFQRARRLEKLLAQLPDALDLMARSIRAGQTMAQALQAIASEFQPPIAAEFAYCYEQQNLGLSPELAFKDLARRTGVLEVKIFILAMLVQRQTGGNLAELLEKLADIVRERFRIRGKIRVLTAEGRAQAAVLLAMPPLLFLLMLALNQTYTQVLLEHPNCLVAVGISMAFGALWIRRIVKFNF